ncbi:MAG: histidinol dehydrogenase [Chloroflexi bacterium]|nr:histidinol dehydrogenase [Chloroflexota bacterium]
MKIIEGFQAAKRVLSRQGPAQATLEADDQIIKKVARIIKGVRKRGDASLLYYTRKYDRVRLTPSSLEVTKELISKAYDKVDSELVSALKLAAARIRSFHLSQKDSLWRTASGQGWLARPLSRVGLYVPGGTASYPSTVLMTAIPAKVAGVKEVIVVTPPRENERKNGYVSPATLVAADIAGVDRVFSIGGAQAVAALAYGTKSIPPVDKICGPGNIYVTLAKKMVYGVVGIDGIFGTSEVLIIADETANPRYCAADLLAQAEHDPLASAILITPSPRLAHEVNREVERQLSVLKRQAIASESLASRGKIALVSSLEEAIELANLYAPEHLCLMITEAASRVDAVTNAGCIFIGQNSSVAMGDYIAGPSHVLPTGGTARFGSPLNVSDFVKLTSLVAIDEANLKELGPAAATIARAEGLEAHALAVEKRLEASR